MNRYQIIRTLQAHATELHQRFKVQHLSLFGSFAREEEREDSDVDLLVEFTAPPRARQFFELQFYLEDLLHHPVDLVTDKALRPQLRPYVEQSMERIL